MTDEKISLRNWVNEKCDQFEDLWLAGSPPSFCSYLSAVEGSDKQKALILPLLELEAFYRKQNGDSVDVASIRDAFPQFASELEILVRSNESESTAVFNAESTETQGSLSGDTAFHVTQNSSEADIPEHFGRYKIIKTLGKGGMGVVYLAEDTELNREVALKIPKFPEGQNEIEDRFRREAKAAARLQHRNICPVFDIATYDKQLFITMAYIKGRPLSDFIKPEKLPSGSAVAKTIRKLALALQEAHDHGIVHRDLKPANIMIDHKQEPVVMDFGLARYQITDERQLTTSGMIIGTPTYMSPEQVRDSGSAGPAADIYSLGVIMYQMLTGKVPFSGDMMSVITSIVLDEPESPSSIRKRVSPQLEKICLKALNKKPEDRFESMAEFASQLTRFLRERKTANDSNVTAADELVAKSSIANKVIAQVPSKTLKEKKPSSGGRAIWISVASVGLLGIVALAFAMIPGEEPSTIADDGELIATIKPQTESVDSKPDRIADDASIESEPQELPNEPAGIVDNLIERGAIFKENPNDEPLGAGQWRAARSSVRSAVLNQPKLSRASVEAVAEMFPSLSAVEIQLSTAPPEAIKALSNLKHDAITLTCTSGTEVMSTAQVEAISGIKSLFQLHLQNCMLEDRHMKAIAELPNLVCLDLRNNRVSVNGLKHLKQAPMLYELWLEDPYEPSDEFFEVLGSFPKIDRLTINLRNNNDLKAVCKRPLKSIFFLNAKGIDDLSPLLGLPLEGIHTDMDLSRQKEVLMKIATLETINGMNRDDFFAEN